MVDKTVEVNSFFGIKAGMTRIFDENGKHVPVTVIKLIPNHISQVKTEEKDGYSAYQIAYGEKRKALVTKAVQGRLTKANIPPVFTKFNEVQATEINSEMLGAKVNLANFPKNTFIDVTGVSKGKGFAGVMKRYNFQGGPGAHGSKFHRTTGSIGNRATPARVFAEKKMPGHMGSEKTTVQNLVVVDVNVEQGYLLIKGSVPGSKNGFVKISKAIKK